MFRNSILPQICMNSFFSSSPVALNSIIHHYKKNASKISSLRRFPLPYTWDESLHGSFWNVLQNNTFTLSNVFCLAIKPRYQATFALWLNGIFALFNTGFLPYLMVCFPLPYTLGESFCTVFSAVFYPIILSRYQTVFALWLNGFFALFKFLPYLMVSLIYIIYLYL